MLAPAGGKDAAYAALHYGADAVYTGLSRFSARAEADNMTLESLDELAAYAHSLVPVRRVFVTVNTLIQDRELPDVVRLLGDVRDIGVDAVIVQDAGVLRILNRHFPELRVHASTQMAVHNLEGARRLRALGCRRVVLARELTLVEIRHIAAASGLETEVFIHGALCYSYSGLCLFSSHAMGRSGNRGRCAYCCRESFSPGTGRYVPSAAGLPFSMKDLALGDYLPALREAGVSSLKIEGRMKSALYVAAVTDYYRRRLDGALSDAQARALESDLQTIFSRPWTPLYLPGSPDAPVIDSRTVGHRGTPVGRVESIRTDATGKVWLVFQSSRALEKHDGLQIDLPGSAQPFGFAVNGLRLVGKSGVSGSLVIQTAAGARVEVELPVDYPVLPAGAPVYCASSQAVKRRYDFERPRPGVFRMRRSLRVRVALRRDGVRVAAPLSDGNGQVEITLEGPYDTARQPDKTRAAWTSSFERIRDTGWELESLDLEDPDHLFVPLPAIHDARRRLMEAVTAAWTQERNALLQGLARTVMLAPDEPRRPSRGERWTLKLRSGCGLDRWDEPDAQTPDEIVCAWSSPADERVIRREWETWSRLFPGRVLRMALPLIIRQADTDALVRLVRALRADGQAHWEVSGLGGLELLQAACDGKLPPDCTADWPLYVLNRQSYAALRAWGIERVTASPEDDRNNLTELIAVAGDRVEVTVFQFTPLFLSETRPETTGMDLMARNGEGYHIRQDGSRWAMIRDRPYQLVAHLDALRKAGARCFRVDLQHAPGDPDEWVRLWRRVRTGDPVPGGYEANFIRGLA